MTKDGMSFLKKSTFSKTIGDGPTTSLLMSTTSGATISPREIVTSPASSRFDSRISKLARVSFTPAMLISPLLEKVPTKLINEKCFSTSLHPHTFLP